MERLQKYLSACGVASRRKSEEIILAGKVKVNGVVITELGYKVSDKDVVSVDGKKTLPAGLVKCPVNSLSTSDGNVEASNVLYAFTVYTRNTGKYAVKIIKIVA